MENIKFINLPTAETSFSREVFSALRFQPQPQQTVYLPFSLVAEPAPAYNSPQPHTTQGVQTTLNFPDQNLPDKFLPLGIVRELHQLCNGTLFEPVPEENFFYALNLRLGGQPLKIRNRETSRTCFLIHQIAHRLNDYIKDLWEPRILSMLHIKQSTYEAKGTLDAISPNKKNRVFAKKLDTILCAL